VSDDTRATFLAALGFPPDPFQRDAMDALDAGRSVLVAAPTGAGKTVVGEYACHRALADGGRCFYTTPIKALSNQKLRELAERYGEANVGLLTGDRSVNGDAPLVVMTTEVLRNMIYEASPALDDLHAVVLDEVHYLADRSRGAVWEEVIVQLPARVQLAALSATVSNAEEFGEWLDEARGGCEVIVEEHRPVPLRHHYYVNDTVHPTFKVGRQGGSARTDEQLEAAAQARGGVPNPDVLILERNVRNRSRGGRGGRHGRGRGGPPTRLRWPDRPTVVDELAHRGWLPAIMFVFSRRGCDDAVDQLVRAGVRLTSPEEADEIAVVVDTLLANVPEADLALLGHARFRSALLDGVAAHHAGMVPAFKEAVEVCFQRGLLKVVVATETLALGINMPARTVVIERLEKWNGESHELLTAGQYTQLTGRAGRRGIDDIGHAVVLYQRDLDFRTVAGLVGTRTYPLHSSFAPSYNMAVNLLRRHDLAEARELLEASFAQFRADRSVGGLHAELAEAETGVAGYARHLSCDRGDWAAYWALRSELTGLEKQEAKERRRRGREAVEEGIEALRPGDVVHVPGLGRRGMVAVVSVGRTKAGSPLAQVVTDARSLARVGTRELDAAPQVVDRVRLPGRGNARQTSYRADVAAELRAVREPTALDDHDGTPRADRGPSDRVELLRAELRAHPCHGCEDRPDHERWQRRADGLHGDVARIRGDIQRRTGSLVRQLDRTLDVLGRLDYVDDAPAPTAAGLLLAGIHSEVDLLVAEALRRGLLDDLGPAELAAVAAALVYESRRDEPDDDPWLPTATIADVFDDLEDVAEELRAVEQAAGLPSLRQLDAGFVGAAWLWAQGGTLDESIGDLELTGGDFVRVVKHLADLIGQIRSVAEPDLADAASAALDRLRRGIVEA
jgi:ATP-dependent RNA helicase HelY